MLDIGPAFATAGCARPRKGRGTWLILAGVVAVMRINIIGCFDAILKPSINES